MQERLKDRYIDPFTDFGFKKLFGEECNKELLLDFLNELLHTEEGKIVSLSYLKTERLGISEESRKAVFDLYCENEKGEKFIVELQKTKQTFFKDRTLYYSTFPIVQQAIPGDWSFELKAIYTIAILNFVFDEDKHNTEKYRYDVMLTDIETHKIFYDKLTFIYLEMPKFTKSAEELETRFEKWMYVLKNLKRLENIPDKLRERIFEKMFSVAEIAKLTEDEYQDYIDSLNSYRDLQNSIDTAKAEGRAEGLRDLQNSIDTAKAEGEAIGRVEERFEVVRNSLRAGLSVETISQITGLSLKEIETLK
ncbi:MAG: Rpn family recombination-promoting nuclease/putative transposase [Bacteroidetes bacterium]|nr:Rpn family recombination-promoting nuclease/putative transposase [Bacteroidota bacterium]